MPAAAGRIALTQKKAATAEMTLSRLGFKSRIMTRNVNEGVEK
jgi:hypothetical protein